MKVERDETLYAKTHSVFRDNPLSEYTASRLAEYVGISETTAKKYIKFLRDEYGQNYIKDRWEKNATNKGQHKLYRFGGYNEYGTIKESVYQDITGLRLEKEPGRQTYPQRCECGGAWVRGAICTSCKMPFKPRKVVMV